MGKAAGHKRRERDLGTMLGKCGGKINVDKPLLHQEEDQAFLWLSMGGSLDVDSNRQPSSCNLKWLRPRRIPPQACSECIHQPTCAFKHFYVSRTILFPLFSHCHPPHPWGLLDKWGRTIYSAFSAVTGLLFHVLEWQCAPSHSFWCKRTCETYCCLSLCELQFWQGLRGVYLITIHLLASCYFHAESMGLKLDNKHTGLGHLFIIYPGNSYR